MFVEDCYKLGYIHKAYGIKGELIVRTELRLSENIIKKWESIFIEINGILVPFFIEQINKKLDVELLIKLEDIKDEIQVKVHVGRNIFIDKEVYQEEENNNVSFEWIGYNLVDKGNLYIGNVIALIKYPGQDMLEINTKQFDKIMIPAIEDWVISIDTEAKEIVIDLPNGLINLNQTESNIF